MNKLSRPIIIILLIVINSCNDNPTGPDTANTYFPLTKGNTWYYRDYRAPYNSDTIKFTNPDKEYDIIYKVIGEENINGKEYSIIEERYFLKESRPLDTAYYRTEGENLYRLIRDWTTHEYRGGLYAKFTVSEGNTFHCELPNYEYTAIVLQKTSTITKLHYYIPGGADEEFELTFNKNIGLVRSLSTDWGMGKVLAKYELK